MNHLGVDMVQSCPFKGKAPETSRCPQKGILFCKFFEWNKNLNFVDTVFCTTFKHVNLTMCIFVPSTCASEDPPHFKSHFTNAHYAGLQLPLAITVCTCP